MDTLITEHYRNPDTLSETDVKDEAAAFLVAGQDTTAWALTWIAYRIGLDPKIQALVHEEVDKVIGTDLERQLTKSDLFKLEYLDMVVSEGLRLYPTVPFIGRTIGEDMVVNGHTLPKGLSVTVGLQAVNRDPRHWDRAEEFRPERWADRNCVANRHPFASMPFSGGPRNCVGYKLARNKMKIVLATFFRRFHVQSVVPLHKSRTNGCGIVNTSVDPIPVHLRLRIEDTL